MKIKILNALVDSKNLFVSGCYVPENADEKEMLELLREVLKEENKTVDGEIMCKRFVANDKTILFKSITIDTLYSLLYLHKNAFQLHFHIVMGKRMENSRLKKDIEQYFVEHKL